MVQPSVSKASHSPVRLTKDMDLARRRFIIIYLKPKDIDPQAGFAMHNNIAFLLVQQEIIIRLHHPLPRGVL